MNQKYEQEISEKWGNTDTFDEYINKTKNYTDEKWKSLSEKMSKIFIRFSEFKRSERGYEDIEVQKLVFELKEFISKNYYNCTNCLLLNLGQMYVSDKRFSDYVDKNELGTAHYLNSAIEFYYSKNNK